MLEINNAMNKVLFALKHKMKTMKVWPHVCLMRSCVVDRMLKIETPLLLSVGCFFSLFFSLFFFSFFFVVVLCFVV